MKTITQEEFEQIKSSKKFEDLLFADLNIQHWNFEEITHISNCSFRNCQLGNEVNFVRNVFKNVTFQDCTLRGVTFRGMIANVHFLSSKLVKDCSFENVGLNSCSFNNCYIMGCDFKNSMWIGSFIEGGEFLYNDINGLKYRVTGDLFNNVKYENNSGNIKRL
jgi:uncharacterized protein YjbI with pentapeptide repeats